MFKPTKEQTEKTLIELLDELYNDWGEECFTQG